jgi:hypothetical protein
MPHAQRCAVDPEGWHIIPPTTVTGTLFDTKPVNVDFTVRRFPFCANLEALD